MGTDNHSRDPFIHFTKRNDDSLDDGREGEERKREGREEEEEIKITRTTRQVTLSPLFLILIILPSSIVLPSFFIDSFLAAASLESCGKGRRGKKEGKRE